MHGNRYEFIHHDTTLIEAVRECAVALNTLQDAPVRSQLMYRDSLKKLAQSLGRHLDRAGVTWQDLIEAASMPAILEVNEYLGRESADLQWLLSTRVDLANKRIPLDREVEYTTPPGDELVDLEGYVGYVHAME